jgi:hypothetical protein
MTIVDESDDMRPGYDYVHQIRRLTVFLSLKSLV